MTTRRLLVALRLNLLHPLDVPSSENKLVGGIKMRGHGDFDFDIWATHTGNMPREMFDDIVRCTTYYGDTTLNDIPRNWDELCQILEVWLERRPHLEEWEFRSGKKREWVRCNHELSRYNEAFDTLKDWRLVDDDGNFKTITCEGTKTGKYYCFHMGSS